ncbi:unnamed protein product [Amoebophrya sp. A25]|nr:unnamed protein product [Amoebophrya sp. A25]|eukprot:GSA25T00010230001.1
MSSRSFPSTGETTTYKGTSTTMSFFSAWSLLLLLTTPASLEVDLVSSTTFINCRSVKKNKNFLMSTSKKKRVLPNAPCSCEYCEQGMLQSCVNEYHARRQVNTCVATAAAFCSLMDGDQILQTDVVKERDLQLANLEAAAGVNSTSTNNFQSWTMGADVPVASFCLHECRPTSTRWPALHVNAEAEVLSSLSFRSGSEAAARTTSFLQQEQERERRSVQSQRPAPPEWTHWSPSSCVPISAEFATKLALFHNQTEAVVDLNICAGDPHAASTDARTTRSNSTSN